ncbi:pitrilysin family protein [Mesorhizobium sp. LHD-90]|uniref:M16 family metallopeptidase n=1 Tax=Mesorhizobium sp. LHD-90 TaxID=3071414 RepID=UPI0027E02411|nr:pitrilysin family protein [Mesorhizobium sp. LHD-90]MDQ6435055.1 pitrilysin family protein [Mesorhizobium sp. LHD-90]
MRNHAATHIGSAAKALSLLLLIVSFPAQAAVKIQEVTSPGGITAWLVEDYSVPIVSLRFSFAGGETQDPPGKEGMANLITGLFDEGAGDLDSDAFQTRLDDAGAEMRFNASRDNIYGAMRMLADQKDEALELMRLAITQPRFDQAPVDRIRNQIISGIQSQAKDPQTEATRRWLKAIYGDHPYSRPDEGTEESLKTITADDLRAFHKALLAREQLHVAVVGAIDAETLKRDLDKLFGGLPEKPALTPVADIAPKLGQVVRYDYPLPQTGLHLTYPGVARKDADFFPAVVMNHILGGGSFTSRLFKEVREKRGLTYGIDSSIVNYEHANALTVGTSTRAGKGSETLGIIREVVKEMAENGPTEQELAAAKKYMIGAYAINNLDSSSSIASTLVELQNVGLGADYFERRADFINAVTVDQAKAVAKKLLSVEPAVLIVGPAEDKGEAGN